MSTGQSLNGERARFADAVHDFFLHPSRETFAADLRDVFETGGSLFKAMTGRSKQAVDSTVEVEPIQK